MISSPITSRPEDLPPILKQFGGGLLKGAMAQEEMIGLKAIFTKMIETLRANPSYASVTEAVYGNGGLQLGAFADVPVMMEMARMVTQSLLARHREWLIQYLGGPAVVPLGFITYRFHEPMGAGINPTTLVAFHQDRYFLGDIPMVNFWLPFDSCNNDAPGLELITVGETQDLRNRLPVMKFDIGNPASAHTLEQIQAVYPPDAFFHPPVDIGDAMVFNNFMPHRSYVIPGMNRGRSNLEVRVFREGQLPGGYDNMVPFHI